MEERSLRVYADKTFFTRITNTLTKMFIPTRIGLNAMAISMKIKGVVGKPCPDYTDENVSMKVVRIVQSYVNVVNRMVWREDI